MRQTVRGGSTKIVLPNSSHVCCRCWCCCRFVTQKRGRWRERELWFPRTQQLLQLRGELKAKVEKMLHVHTCTLFPTNSILRSVCDLSSAAVKKVSHKISPVAHTVSLIARRRLVKNRKKGIYMYTANTWLYRQKNLSQAPFSNRYTYPLASMQLGHTYKPEQIRKKKKAQRSPPPHVLPNRFNDYLLFFLSLSLRSSVGDSTIQGWIDSTIRTGITWFPLVWRQVSLNFFSLHFCMSHTFTRVCESLPLWRPGPAISRATDSPGKPQFPLCYSWLSLSLLLY